jgi:hypothetical protein
MVHDIINTGSLGSSGVGLLKSLKLVSTMGRVSSGVGVASTFTSLVYDYHAYSLGDIGGFRFAWRTGGNFALIGVGIWASSYGGPIGAAAGGTVGAGFWAAEKAYDGLKWYGTELSTGAVNFQNNCASFFSR